MVSAFKYVRILDTEDANNLGIPTECPVLISPYISSAVKCNECTHTYTPLLYAAGFETYAHHFHTNNGGIYYHKNHFPQNWFPSGDHPWVLIVEPLGNVCEPYGGRAEGIRVVRVVAFCERGSNKHRQSEPIHEGGLYKNNAGRLQAICPEHMAQMSKYQLKYMFSINDEGQLSFHFTQIVEPKPKIIRPSKLRRIRKRRARLERMRAQTTN